DLSVIIDESRSLNDGAILVPGYKADGWMVRGYSESGLLDGDKPVRDYTETERHDLLYREKGKIKALGMNMTYMGLIHKLRESMFSKDPQSLQPHVRRFVESAAVFTDCPAC